MLSGSCLLASHFLHLCLLFVCFCVVSFFCFLLCICLFLFCFCVSFFFCVLFLCWCLLCFSCFFVFLFVSFVCLLLCLVFVAFIVFCCFCFFVVVSKVNQSFENMFVPKKTGSRRRAAVFLFKIFACTALQQRITHDVQGAHDCHEDEWEHQDLQHTAAYSQAL